MRKPFSLGEIEGGSEVAFNAYGLTTKEEDKIKHIPLELLDTHDQNRYSVRHDQKMQELIQSISEYGVLEPLIVIQEGDRYTVLAGERRKFASEKAGLTSVPCIVREADENEQDHIIVDTNNQREQSISEKAWGYRLKYDAERRKSGHRSDLTGEEGGSTIEKLSCGSEDSKSQIARLIRITHLNNDLLNLVDEGLLPLHSAEILSFIDDKGQNLLSEVLSKHDKRKVSIDESEVIRSAAKNEELTEDFLEKLLFGKGESSGSSNETSKELKKIERFNKITKDCFPSDADKYINFMERESLITRLLSEWFAEQRRKEDGYDS